jgi:hypothetical protein
MGQKVVITHLGYKYLLNDTLKKDHTSFIMTRKNEWA